AHHGLVTGQSIVEGIVRKAGIVGVLEEDHAIAWTEDTSRIEAIPIPVPANSYIADVAQIETHLGGTCIIAVPQEELSDRWTIHSKRIIAIAVPIACDGLIANLPKIKNDRGETNRIFIPQIEGAPAVDADGDSAIPIPVAY